MRLSHAFEKYMRFVILQIRRRHLNPVGAHRLAVDRQARIEKGQLNV